MKKGKRAICLWDAPFGWARMQIIAVAGVRRYGYYVPANRISLKFLSLVLKEFNEHNVIVEQYDVERRDLGFAPV